MIRFTVVWLFGVASILALAGCGDNTKPSEFKNKPDAHDHSDHTGGKEDATLPGGKKCHAVMATHITTEGILFEVSFETQDKEPKPLTVGEKTKITARVTREGDDNPHTLEFKPAPKKERESDPAGQCSMFEAAANFVPSDKLIITLSIEGVAEQVVWVKFVPNDHIHKD